MSRRGEPKKSHIYNECYLFTAIVVIVLLSSVTFFRSFPLRSSFEWITFCLHMEIKTQSFWFFLSLPFVSTSFRWFRLLLLLLFFRWCLWFICFVWFTWLATEKKWKDHKCAHMTDKIHWTEVGSGIVGGLLKFILQKQWQIMYWHEFESSNYFFRIDSVQFRCQFFSLTKSKMFNKKKCKIIFRW